MRGRKKQSLNIDDLRTEVTRINRTINKALRDLELVELKMVEIDREENVTSGVEATFKTANDFVLYGVSKKKQVAKIKALTIKPIM